MKKVLKSLLVLCAIFVMAITFVACGGEDSDETTSENLDDAINFWNFFTGPDGNNMNNLIDAFNKTNPEFSINNITMAGGDLYQKIPTVVNSGTGVPDLCIVDVARIPMFFDQGLLDSMDEILNLVPDINKENYREAVWETGEFDGVQYSIPLDMGVTGLVYNKDLVEKYAPDVLDDDVLTIDEIMEIIPKAKEDDIITLPISFFTYEMALSLMAQKGGTLFAEDGVTPTLDNTELIEAYETLASIQSARSHCSLARVSDSNVIKIDLS